MTFPKNSSFGVDPDVARQRIAAARLGETMSKANESKKLLAIVQRYISSWAATLDDVIFEWNEDDPEWNDMQERLIDVEKSMDALLSSMRDSKAPIDHSDSPSRIGKDDLD